MTRRIRSRFLPSDATLFLVLATVWGLSFVAIEAGLRHVPPLYFASVRYALAGVLVLGYAAATTDRVRPHGRTEWLNVAVVGLFLVFGYHALLYVGQLSVPGPVAAVVVSLSPILTAAFAATLLDDSLDAVVAGGFLVGLLGVAVVADLDLSNLLAADVYGIGLLFVAAAAFALGSVLSTPLRTALADVSMQGWAMLLGAAALFAGSLAREESPAAVEWTGAALAALAYLTLFSGVVGFLVYFALHERIGPAESNLVSYFQPIVAAFGGWALLGQTVTPTTVAGFLGIFAGFLLVKHETVRARVGVAGVQSPGPFALQVSFERRLRWLRCNGRAVYYGHDPDCNDTATAAVGFGQDAD
ncbi:DMT family transporter [Halobellus ordinarius]|uniref:DMT family transporter n=1 Tax=Halobellus ordinarius TaxID=3075120 RepID=UPI002880A54C|nr:DMT family transporter [Halobellus sp. ZY16]